MNEFKRTSKEHATDEKMLARDDEVDSFQSYGSMTDHRWKSIKALSKQGCVQDIFVFTLTMTFFLQKATFLMQANALIKKKFSFGFILRDCSDNSFRY